jgi:plastocyanin
MKLLRSLAVMPACLLAGALATACVAENPGWTYTPAPPVTPPPSVDASASASAEPSGDSGAIQISATGIAFEQAEVNAPAGEPFQIEFANNDPGVPHDVTIRQGDANGEEVFKGDTFNGVETRTYDVPALDAGAYAFVCSVHPNMVGTLTVE